MTIRRPDHGRVTAAWRRLRSPRHWRHAELLAPRAPVLIDELISPLRYDVLVRQSFFSLLSNQWELYSTDPDAFVVLARNHPYFEWFQMIVHPRTRTPVPRDVHRAFGERVRKAADLYQSFQRNGFDPRTPIVVSSAGPVAVSPTGKILHGRCFPGDGCHRLALLRLAGHRELRPEWYRVRVGLDWRPPDHTHSLIPLLGLSTDDYFSFLSLGYAGSEFREEARLVADLEARNPQQAQELRQIITVDRPILAPATRTGDSATSRR